MWNWLGITNEPKPTANENNKDAPTTENTDNSSQEKESNSTEKTVSDAATNLTNYLYSFADKASKTATKLKESVDQKLEKTIVGDFNKENEKFVQERDHRRVGDAVPPWVGFHEEEVMKSQILALSADERNLLRDPPSGVEFQFNLQQIMPIALAVLKEDADLEQMRFELVPKKIKEERFWRNYFYRVSLIKQSTQLSSLTLNKDNTKSSESLNKSFDKSLESSPRLSRDSPEKQDSYDNLEDAAGSPTTHEFASDAFDDTAHLSEEEKTQMMGMKGVNESNVAKDSTATNDDDDKKKEDNADWELDQELQQELESFELVNDNDGGAGDNEDGDDEWQKEIEELLDEGGEDDKENGANTS